MSGGSTWRWQPDITVARAAVLQGAQDGMTAATQALLDMANELVPVATGELRDSGATAVAAEGQVVHGAVSYGTDEAVPQHERLDYAHNDGQAKYLEQPLFAGKDELLGHLADGLSQAMHS